MLEVGLSDYHGNDENIIGAEKTALVNNTTTLTITMDSVKIVNLGL